MRATASSAATRRRRRYCGPTPKPPAPVAFTKSSIVRIIQSCTLGGASDMAPPIHASWWASNSRHGYAYASSRTPLARAYCTMSTMSAGAPSTSGDQAPSRNCSPIPNQRLASQPQPSVVLARDACAACCAAHRPRAVTPNSALRSMMRLYSVRPASVPASI